MAGDGWTEDQIREFNRLYASRVGNNPSYEAIGEMIGKSKGSVCGRARRMEQKIRLDIIAGEPVDEATKKRLTFPAMNRTGTNKSLPPEPVTMDGETLEPLGLPEMPLNSSRECAYIHSDPRQPGWRYCGHPAVEGISYCEPHKNVCLKPPEKRKR